MICIPIKSTSISRAYLLSFSVVIQNQTFVADYRVLFEKKAKKMRRRRKEKQSGFVPRCLGSYWSGSGV